METLFKVGVITLVVWKIITAFPVMWLVNGLLAPSAVHAVFGVEKIGFWTALGLNFLCSVLFKGVSSSSKSS